MSGGYIKLDRQITENPIWTRERISYAQAFIDLILLAAWKATRILRGGVWIPVKHGGCAWASPSNALNLASLNRTDGMNACIGP
jgi:hypothetical protein